LPSRCYPHELQGQADEKFSHLAEMSSDLDWYQGQYESLDAMVEALQTDNDWLEYRLMAAEVALHRTTHLGGKSSQGG
jgi:hypothetical protein